MSPQERSALIQKAAKAAEQHKGDEEDISQEFLDVIHAIDDLPEDHRIEAMADLANAVEFIAAPCGAGVLSVWIGSKVEDGHDPAATFDPLLRKFLKLGQTIAVPAEDEEWDEDALDDEILQGMELLGRSIVSHMCHSPSLRDKAAADTRLTKSLRDWADVSNGAIWILELLRQQTGELLVIHGEADKGFRIAYSNIGRAFHFFTLLQHALEGRMPGARHADARLIAIARGKEHGDAHDKAWWHYGQGNSPQPELSKSVWGEGTMDEIDRINDTRVMILWPPLMERGWNSSFFTPILSLRLPDVRIAGELSPDEVVMWKARLGLPGKRTPES